MQLSNAPGKLLLPFANAGAKNSIPVASQIGITAGAASLTDGFPPLTRTPIAAGGVPPSGLDMNGILYALSAALRWANAGGGYAFDSAFATDSDVGGYPKGARVMRSDGLGYWFNTVENNTTDPESTGAGVAAAAGWVPDFANGVTTVAMASANVTLTPVQYGKPVIVITGTLTANLNLIFPTLVNEWTVINNTTGAFLITCKTAAGTGVVVNTAALIVGDGTNIQSAITDAAPIFGNQTFTSSGTFTVPQNVTTVYLTGTGGGGGGAGGPTAASGGGGGGSGAVAIKRAVTVTPGDAITVTIGANGDGGASGLAGGTGGTTSFGALLSLAGGTGGSPAAGGGSGGGASGGSGGLAFPGQPGTQYNSYGSTSGGNGGSTPFGSGGAAGVGIISAQAGYGFGAGGGGAPSVGNVGASAAFGFLTIEW